MADGGGLSELGVLVAQLESVVHSGSQKPLQPLMCFDLLSDLLSTLDRESKDNLLPVQRKGEDALQNLLLLGIRPPVRRLASAAMIKFIELGDSISIYSRASSLQGWLSDKADVRKSDPASCIGAAQCLGALYKAFGDRITSGLVETSSIVGKLLKASEVRIRQAGLQLLQDALEGSGGGGPFAAYVEAIRMIFKVGLNDKSAAVRAAAAGCLRAVAMTGGPGVGSGGLEPCINLCLKGLEDVFQCVRDGYAAALGALLALGLNPAVQVQPKGKGPSAPPKALEGVLQKHLIIPFLRASGPRSKDIRFGLTMAWVSFLQGMNLTYGHNDMELAHLGMEAVSMLTSSLDAHALACVQYILRVGVAEQMGEPAQKEFTFLLTKELSGPDNSSPRLIAILRTIAYLLVTLGEVSLACREALDNSLVETLSNPSIAVRVEAALTLRALAEVDPTCANNLLSCGVTTLRAIREIVVVEKGERLRVELDSLHGQAAMLAALLAVCPRLPLGVPFRLPSAILEVAKKMVSQQSAKSLSAPAEKEAGWMLIGALVSSMPKQELEEQEWELIALWATEFGGNHRDQLNQAERNLPAHLRSWSAAAEALTAFVKSYVVPSSAVNDKEFLLQPIIAYLSSALKYLAFPALQQAPLTLKSAIDLFTIRILRAYQALPDPLVYRDDHVELLGICSLPFREPEKYGASSCLRQLLDTGDASLGPWVPGRDFFEDELRAFEGAADGFSPCVWDIEVPAFAQPLPLATLLVNDMLLCFGNVFAAQGVEFLSQPVKNKLQLLDLMGNRTAGKKQGWKASFTTNVCVALLGGLKASLGVRGQGVDAEALRQVQEILLGILADDSISSAERRAASESLGVLARLGSDSYAARLARLLLTNAISAQTATQKGSLALALGCIHRSVGGMALSALVPSTVQVLCALAKDPTDALHIWSLHGLWLTAEAAGLSYVPHVQATLSVVMELLLSDEHASPELGQSVGRLINAIVAVLGPELSPISSFFMRCKSVVAEINTGEMPAALLECVRFTQQLALFAPQAVSVSSHVQTLRPTLSSRQPTLRQAAVATLRHLVERDSVSLVEEHIEEDLFAMLDSETDERIIRSVRQTLQRLLEAACPSFPSRWLHLCRNVVLATAATKHAASGFLEYEASTSGRLDITPLDDMPMGEDDEGMIVNNAAGKETKKSESKGVEANLPRYKTRLFAAECLSRLPIAVGGNPAHFDLVIAKEQTGGHWLVLHLGELVALAYQVATGSLESVRPMGVELLDTILDKFGKTADPEFEGHLLLEQYQAQLVSAVRTALEPSAGPLLMSVGSRLAARIITSGVAGGDRGVLQRVVALISRPLAKWADLRIPSYAEWVGCKLQVSILGAHAAVKTYAFACSKEGPPKAPDSFVLLPLLAPHTQLLGRCWIGLLRDYISIRTQWATKMQPRYEPFLDGVQLAAVAEVVLPHLAECWPVVLEAVTIDVAPVSQGDEKAPPVTGIEINGDEFKQVWALAILIISADERQGPNLGRSITSFPSFNRRILSSSPTSNHQLVALSALGALCAKGFYRPGMLSVELCQELLQLLLAPRLNNYPWVPGAIVYIVEQIINSSPDVYMEEKSLVLKVAELCLGYMHQLQESNSNQMWNSSETDALVCFALRAASSLTCRLSEECQQLLLPQFLSAGIKVLSEASGNSASASVTFITTVTNATSKFSEDAGSSGGFGKEERASVLASSVESLARVFETNVTIASKIDDQVLSKRVLLVLGVMVAMAKSVPDVAEFKQGSQARCLSCLQSSLSITHPTIQLAGLQTLRTVAQAGSAEHPRGEKFAWALLLLHKLSSDVIAVIYKESKDTMTSAAAGLVGEALKLLVLLHSLVDGEEAQLEVLHVLLPAIIAAASVDGKENQAALALINAAVKLVTHLASVPSTATQFRKVLLDMPAESRQQLQSIIRASMAQHDSANPSFPTALPPASIPKPVLPPPSSGFLPPPPASAQFIVRTSSTALTSQASLDFDDDDEVDDDWDDFQAHEGNEESPADSSMQPVEDQTEREASEPQASSPHPSTSTSTDLVDEDVKEAMPAQKTGDDTADSLVDSANRTVEKEKLEEDSSVSSLSNSVASPSTSRVPETFPSEFEDEDDMWDSFESAPVIQSGAEETSAVSLHKHDDDDIWDSSLPGEAEKSQRDVEPLVHLHGSNSLEGHGLDVEGDNVEGSANLKEGLASLAADGEVTSGHADADVEKDSGADSGDVFEEAVEEIHTNSSMHDISDPAETPEVSSGTDLHKQDVDHGGLITLAGAESEGRPLEHNYSENGHVVKVAINVTAVQKDELVDGDELERVENLQSSEAATT
ncbi:protein SWEETIE isoform X1 [Physcomitrium patens]|uniref:Uncharacterized protein n=1 Tax=Physcomitrium patens TaxID=3218 RepID=A0A2K1JBR3_PHYPA|nr:protein SWEETIE-like isoform X1 [Physcomitrium patens]PNR38951.1 hypothetical protein PHYPA_019229 [Physcomitrium patens]|eukprot:XP_024396228.1 protein SWEETIE-like isoform X1 [Physcomitrella patens]